MTKFKLVAKNGELKPNDKKLMVEGLLSHHAKSGHPRKTDNFSVVVKLGKKTVGSVGVTYLWNGMEINSLWVRDDLRGQGLGKKLMEAVEDEAKKRGVEIAYTNTFPWQAPKFYEKLGYKIYGKLDGFPKGSSLSYYFKKIHSKN